MIGWIKLHRKLLDNAIFYKPDYFQIWVYILLNVNHEEKSFIWNNEKKTLKKGSGIFSQKEMAKVFKFDISKINRILNYLKNENQIEIKSTNKYTEIEILNWLEYQEAIENGNQKQTKNKPSANPEETQQKPKTNLAQTNKNVNNEKNEKELKEGKEHLFSLSPFYVFELFEKEFSGTDYEVYDAKVYYEKVKNWSAGGGKKKIDWIATTRSMMTRDQSEGKASMKKVEGEIKKELVTPLGGPKVIKGNFFDKR